MLMSAVIPKFLSGVVPVLTEPVTGHKLSPVAFPMRSPNVSPACKLTNSLLCPSPA